MQTNAFLRLGAAAALVGLAACVSTDMASQANPEYAGRTYRKVMVEGEIADLRWRQKVEYEFCDRITDKTDSDCVQSAAVFFPGQSYTEAEVQKRLADQHIDAILVIKGNSGVNSTYVPPTIYANTTTNVNGTVSPSGYNNVNVSGTADRQTTIQAVGGGTIDKPWATYQASLWQTQDKKVVWYGSGKVDGDAFSDLHQLIQDAAEDTVKHMMDDGVMQAPAKK
jgi:hypothetical protein